LNVISDTINDFIVCVSNTAALCTMYESVTHNNGQTRGRHMCKLFLYRHIRQQDTCWARPVSDSWVFLSVELVYTSTCVWRTFLIYCHVCARTWGKPTCVRTVVLPEATY